MLDVKDLTIAYEKDKLLLTAVRDFSIKIGMGQTYGLVGESGSGKSTIAMAIMRYMSDNAQIVSGEISLDGRPLHDLPLAEMRQLWGRDLSLVPQDPMSSLNPSIRVGEQLAEALRVHQGLSNNVAAERAIELLSMVRVPDPSRVARSYPHQISGGMQQRVLLAQALSSEPKLLVLDEPTTSLDVTTQAAVLDLFRVLIREMHTAVLYISHNLGIVASICDHVAVLYAGELVEDSPVDILFQNPLHPYTQALLDSVPKVGQNKAAVQLQAIPGRIPSIADRDQGCVFAPRCKFAVDICYSERPELESIDPTHRVRCHRWSEISAGEIVVQTLDRQDSKEIEAVEGKTILEINDLMVEFPLSRTLSDTIKRKPKRTVRAVDGIDMTLFHGQTLGVVGESGSGKTTLARTIIGLTERSGGDVKLFGYSLPPRLAKRDLETLRLLQYVFQNPEEALNPYMTIGEILRRPFITLLGQSRAKADENARNLLAAVRLPEEYYERLPSQLSGGEKQRIAIARAFATNPELLLADEPVSSLDVSVQASILNLMNELQADNSNTMLFISHDLAVVGYLADKIAVIYAGQLVEVADATDLFTPPFHPYTEALLSAIPVMDPKAGGSAIRLDGDVPSQIDLPSGCRFHPRCPRFLGDICRDQVPPWQQSPGGKKIFCHISPEELEVKQRPYR